MGPGKLTEIGLARLHRDVAFGEAGGRIIWQPRIGCWYQDKQFSGEPLPEPYQDLDIPGIHRALGCSARLYNPFNRCFRAVEPDTVRRSTRALNEWDTETTIETPVGRQVEVVRRSPNNRGRHHLKWEIADEEEMKVARWRLERTEWTWDAAFFAESVEDVGDLGAPTCYLPRVNVQYMYLNSMGVEKAVEAIYAWDDDLVRSYMRAVDESALRFADLVAASPIEIVNFGDNLHVGTLSPALFTTHVLPAYQERVERLHAAGKFVHSHWDGDCRALLPFARETGLDGIEAITPKPQGDVTLEETKEALGDEMFLIDGIPAIYFDDYVAESVLEETTRRIIDLFAPKLILGISDEISSTGDIERIRLVGRIVDEYNASVS